MGKCFMTLEKIKNYNQMSGKYKHNYREIEVLNADPDKKDLNEELVSLNGKNYKQAFTERVQELGYGTDKKIRTDAVLGFEVITTFSREDAETVDLEKWKENNVKWLREHFNACPEKYGDNVVSVMYHADEPGNVHCHAFIIPIDDKGHLNARYYVRSRQKMIEMQDSYGELMKKEHNLDRGIHGTKATHKDIKKYYAALNAAIEKELPAVKDTETATEYRERANKIYQKASLKIMGLEDKLTREQLEHEQVTKNAVGAARKELFAKFKDKADQMDELVREYGNFSDIKEKCEKSENLEVGINALSSQEGISNSDKASILEIIDSTIDTGKKVRHNRQKGLDDLEK